MWNLLNYGTFPDPLFPTLGQNQGIYIVYIDLCKIWIREKSVFWQITQKQWSVLDFETILQFNILFYSYYVNII